MGNLRRRVPAFGLVFALLCALTVALASPASATPRASHVGHFGKKVVLTCVDHHGQTLRLDQPAATGAQPPAAPTRGVPVQDEIAPDEPLAPIFGCVSTRGPPAGH